VLIHRL